MSSIQTVRVEKVEVGTDKTLTGRPRIFGYIIVTDAATDCTLKIYQTSKSAANQRWEDTAIAADLAKSHGFGHSAIGFDGDDDIVILEVTGGTGVAYVRYDTAALA